MKSILGALLITLSIPVQAAITGIVVDQDGAPITGAVVRAFPLENPMAIAQRVTAGKLERDPMARVATTDGGAFKIETNGAPVITLSVTAAGRQQLEMLAADGEETGPLMIGNAAPWKLKITAEGKPVANAIAVDGTTAVKSGADGIVELPDFGEGNANIVVVHPDYAPASVSAEDVKEIKLATGGFMRGRVVAQDGRTPVPHARVSIGNYRSTETGDDGAFTLSHTPLRWTLMRATSADGAALATPSETRAATTYTMHLRPFASIAGTVRDAKTKAAIAGARMGLSFRNDAPVLDFVTTDAKGNFKFERVPQGVFVINATHPGYTFQPAPIDTSERESPAIAGTPSARIRGVVVDEEKKPVRGAIVSRNATTRFEPARSAVTNARGEFSLRLPMFGAAALANNNVIAAKEGYAGGSAAAKITPGETTTGVTITLSKGVALTVKVVDRDKQPIARASIIITPWRNEAFARSTAVPSSRATDATGTLATRVAPGKYDIAVSGDGIVPKTVNAQTVDAKSASITITVERGVELSGRVVTADGAAVSEASVTLQPAGGVMQSATSDASGAFVFRSAPRGNATVQATLTRSSRLTSGKKDVSAPATDVVITMPRSGAISGRVIDEATKAPVTSFQISARPSSTPPTMPAPFSNDDGTFTIGDLAAGPVQLEVTAKGYAPGNVQGVNVEEGKTTSDVEVHLERGAILKGRVTTSSGQPIEGASISLDRSTRVGMTGPSTANREVTDANGDYSIDTVTPGTRRVTFNKNGYVPLMKSVDAVSGKEVTLDVSLDRGHELQGRVVDESGQPVDAADVRVDMMPMPPVRTLPDGTFTLTGLRDGKTRVIARKNGYVEARSEDVDPSGPPITLTLRRGGTITGRVSGVTEAELGAVVVSASGPAGNTNGRVEANGMFTVQGVADGKYGVDAWFTNGEGRRTPRKMVEVINGSAPPVDLSFNEGATVRGRVTVHGQPLANAGIAFMPSQAALQGVAATSRTESDGTYVATNVPTGEATAFVSAPQQGSVSNEKIVVTNNMIYDVDVRASVVRGRVIDAQTSAPIADAQVLFQPADNGSAGGGVRAATTDYAGRFTSDLVPEHKWRLRVQREKYETGYAEIDVAPGMPEVEVRLSGGTAATVRVVDAQSGAPVLNAYVVATAASNKPVFAGQTKEDGTIQLWVAPGTYTVRASSMQFVAATATINVPGPPVELRLEHAGRIVIASPANARVRLSGGGMTSPLLSSIGRIDNLKPGTYLLELLSADNKVLQQKEVVVIGGQTTTVTF